MSAATAWETLRLYCIILHAGASDYIVADAGRIFSAKEFQSAANNLGIVFKIAPTGGHERIGKLSMHIALFAASTISSILTFRR